MSLYVHCDRCDAKRQVSPGIIAPPQWKIYGEQGTTLGQEFTLCPECGAGLQRWMRLEPDPLEQVRKDWFGDAGAHEIAEILEDWNRQMTKGSTSGTVTIDGRTWNNPRYNSAGTAFQWSDGGWRRYVTFEVDADPPTRTKEEEA